MPSATLMPGDATLAWAEVVLGPVRIVARFAHDHAYSQLWRLATGTDHVWLKMHAHTHKWAAEVHALNPVDPVARARAEGAGLPRRAGGHPSERGRGICGGNGEPRSRG